MTRRPRITYLATTSWTGGAERQVHDLAVRMREAGWDVTAVSMLPLGDSFADLPGQGIPTASLDMKRGVADPRALVRLGMILRDRRPDVLHAHMVHANLLARLSRLIRRTPVVVCTVHSQYQGPRWRSIAYRLTDTLTDATTAVSQVAMTDAVDQGAVSTNRISVVPNGVDLTTYVRRVDTRGRLRAALELGDDFVFLAVGRLAPAKDYPNLVRAFTRLRGTRPHVRLLIAGGGSQAELRACVERAGLQEHVELLGERSDVPELMGAADALVMSSAWEGLPLVLLEAGASELPVVATDVGGNREAVEDGVTGFLVPPRDDASLARSMARLMDLGDHEREAMGIAGRARVTGTFDLGAVADRWDALYRALLTRRTAA